VFKTENGQDEASQLLEVLKSGFAQLDFDSVSANLTEENGRYYSITSGMQMPRRQRCFLLDSKMPLPPPI